MNKSGTIGSRTTFAIALGIMLLAASSVSMVLIHRGHVAAGITGFISMICLLEFVTCGWAVLENLVTWRDRVVVFGTVVHIAAAGLFLAIWLRSMEPSLAAILFPMTLAALLLIQSQTVRLIRVRWLKARSARTAE